MSVATGPDPQPPAFSGRLRGLALTGRRRFRRALNYPYFRWRMRHSDISETGLMMYRATGYSRATIRFFEDAARFQFDSSVPMLIACPLAPGEVVLDVGGYDGGWAVEWRSRYDAFVHVFEPDPEAIPALRDLFADDDGVVLHPVGLAARNAEIELHLGGRSSSVYDRSPARLAGRGRETVRLRAVDEVFAELGLDDVALFKVNIEGGEYDLLDRMIECGLQARCRHVRVQFHDWYPRARRRRRRIVRALERSHEPEWSYPFVWESWRRREAAAAGSEPAAAGPAT